MNKNIKLAVAGAVLALSASAANAGIIIPAGDWTVDIGGNVNSFYTNTRHSGVQTTANYDNQRHQVQTGLLPSAIGIGAKTRQNDLDVAFQFSFFTGSNANGGDNLSNATISNGGLGYSSLNIRQSYLSFGDKSWGTFLLGRNLGVYGSDAILSDMTLLGVGSFAGGQGSSTLGRIGSGYIYADWKAQIAYTTPNFNGFEATAAVTEGTGQIDNNNMNFEGKASYSFAANDVTGKVWVSGISQKQAGQMAFQGVGQTVDDSVAIGGDIGANINFAGFGLTGYYYGGQGMGTTIQFRDGYSINGKQRDSQGGYVQATYILPTKTKIGASWGISELDKAGTDSATSTLVKENEMATVGIYHPLTKHLNLVAEWSHVRSENQAGAENKSNTGSLGGILFF